jgi:hypothetical protein
MVAVTLPKPIGPFAAVMVVPTLNEPLPLVIIPP